MILLGWCQPLQAAVRPEMVVSEPEELKVVIAVLEFFVHCPEQPFYLATRGRAMHLGSDVLDASSSAPTVEFAPLAFSPICTTIVSENLSWSPMDVHYLIKQMGDDFGRHTVELDDGKAVS